MFDLFGIRGVFGFQGIKTSRILNRMNSSQDPYVRLYIKMDAIEQEALNLITPHKNFCNSSKEGRLARVVFTMARPSHYSCSVKNILVSLPSLKDLSIIMLSQFLIIHSYQYYFPY